MTDIKQPELPEPDYRAGVYRLISLAFDCYSGGKMYAQYAKGFADGEAGQAFIDGWIAQRKTKMIHESKIEKYARDRIAEAGGRMLKFVSPGLRGVPDNIVLWPWHYNEVDFIEFKRPKKGVRAEQENVHEILHDLGANILLINTKQGVDEYINAKGCSISLLPTPRD